MPDVDERLEGRLRPTPAPLRSCPRCGALLPAKAVRFWIIGRLIQNRRLDEAARLKAMRAIFPGAEPTSEEIGRLGGQRAQERRGGAQGAAGVHSRGKKRVDAAAPAPSKAQRVKP